MIDAKVHTLLTLVEAGSYTKAAELLHLTQPAVSHHIRLLEKLYGIKIFHPGKKELRLTPEGSILLKYAHRLTAIDHRARQAIEDSRRELTHITIGLTQTGGENKMPQVLALYCREHPGVTINICTDAMKNLYERLRLYELDLAVVEGSLSGGSFGSILLDTDYLCLIVAPTHPFAGRGSVTLAELKQERLILRSPEAGTRILFENYLLSHSENIGAFHVMMELDNIATIKELVASEMGVSIIAHSACLEELRRKKLVMVPIENVVMTRDIRLIYQKDFAHGEVLEELRQIYEMTQYQ